MAARKKGATSKSKAAHRKATPARTHEDFKAGMPVLVGGEKGRICKVSDFSQTCCVQFEDDCLKIGFSGIQAASEPAPECTGACKAGC